MSLNKRKHILDNIQKGFTLIELIIVIIIIGILAAIAIPQFGNMTKKAHTATVQGTFGALKAGLELFASQYAMAQGDYVYPNSGNGSPTFDLKTLLRDNYDGESWTWAAGASDPSSGTITYSGTSPSWTWEYTSPIDDGVCDNALLLTEDACSDGGGSWTAKLNKEKYTIKKKGTVDGQPDDVDLKLFNN